MLPGRDDWTRRQRGAFIEGYERFRRFDRSSLLLIEPLRGMRMVHYTTWLARRWHDPIFPRTWPHFGTDQYWQESTADLEDLVTLIETEEQPAAALVEAEEPALTNKDYFFDWDD
jgi:Ser/Thr protein kinase RdoA (MazF antagonist)